jgi:hypothetical protein
MTHEDIVELENTMAKTKMIKGKTTIYKTLYIKLKIE